MASLDSTWPCLKTQLLNKVGKIHEGFQFISKHISLIISNKKDEDKIQLISYPIKSHFFSKMCFESWHQIVQMICIHLLFQVGKLEIKRRSNQAAKVTMSSSNGFLSWAWKVWVLFWFKQSRLHNSWKNTNKINEIFNYYKYLYHLVRLAEWLDDFSCKTFKHNSSINI